MNELENSTIKLRAVELADIDLLYAWENNTELWTVSNTLVPFSKYILKKYIESSAFDIYTTKQLRLMIDAKTTESTVKQTVGIIDLFDFDPYHNRAGVGILIHKEERNKSYATNALEVLINYAFNTLKLHQLYCNITTDNEMSIRLFRKFDFLIIGEKKEWNKTKTGWVGELMLQLINNK